MRRIRTRAGMSGAVLGGLVGRRAEWVRGRGDRQAADPAAVDAAPLAHALDVSDLAVLTGNGAAVPVEAFVGTAHSALDSVRTALTDYRVDDPTTPGGDVRHLALRLEHAWTVRHSSTHHRTAVGALLPALIRDAQRTVRSTAGEERRAARRVLAGVYQLTDFYVAYQPAPELVWLVADRALTEAQEADDPYLMAGGAWALTQALRDSGRWDEAVSVSEQAARRLEPWLQAHPTTGAACGAHCCSRPGTSTRGAAGMGRRGPTGSADAAARALGPHYRHVQSSFGQAVVHAHAVTLDVELRRAGDAVRRASGFDPGSIVSVPRRSRHLIEVARAHHQLDDGAATYAHLRRAVNTAPGTATFNGYARDMALALRAKPPTGWTEAADRLDGGDATARRRPRRRGGPGPTTPRDRP